jgi:hypothetical protein
MQILIALGRQLIDLPDRQIGNAKRQMFSCFFLSGLADFCLS